MWKKIALGFLIVIIFAALILNELQMGWIEKCGESTIWDFNETTKTLTISGTGPMNDFVSSAVEDSRPWKKHAADIQSVVIKNGVSSIGSYAFYNCENLESISIPNDIASIGTAAFEGTKFYNNNNNWNNNLLYINDYLVKCNPEFEGECVIKNNTRIIAEAAFNGCQKLTKVTIPQGITVIEDLMFNNCYELTSVSIPDTVTSIESLFAAL